MLKQTKKMKVLNMFVVFVMLLTLMASTTFINVSAETSTLYDFETDSTSPFTQFQNYAMGDFSQSIITDDSPYVLNTSNKVLKYSWSGMAATNTLALTTTDADKISTINNIANAVLRARVFIPYSSSMNSITLWAKDAGGRMVAKYVLPATYGWSTIAASAVPAGMTVTQIGIQVNGAFSDGYIYVDDINVEPAPVMFVGADFNDGSIAGFTSNQATSVMSVGDNLDDGTKALRCDFTAAGARTFINFPLTGLSNIKVGDVISMKIFTSQPITVVQCSNSGGNYNAPWIGTVAANAWKTYTYTASSSDKWAAYGVQFTPNATSAGYILIDNITVTPSAVVATPLPTATIPAESFSYQTVLDEGFENGLNVTTLPIYSGASTATVSTTQAHSGTNSIAIKADAKVANNYTPSIKGIYKATVWMYDDISVASPKSVFFADTGSGYKTAIGVESNANWQYRKGTGWVFFTSTLARTTGWHKLTMEFTSDKNVSLYVDDTKIYSSSEETDIALKGVYSQNTMFTFGNLWGGGTAGKFTYFDDAKIEVFLPNIVPTPTPTYSPAPTATPEPTPTSTPISMTNNWYTRAKQGLFVHYVPNVSYYPTGETSGDINEVADSFDVQQLANDAQAFGAEYVVFTALHYRMRPLYPSAVTEQYRPGNSSERDVIRDLINALKPKGIKLILYVHATDGYDFATDKERTDSGWYGNSTTVVSGRENAVPTSVCVPTDFPVWNNYVNGVFAEIGNRYGQDLDGLWCDMVFETHHQEMIDKQRLYNSSKTGYPNRIFIGNENTTTRTAEQDILDYTSAEYYPGNDVNTWRTFNNQIATVVGGEWAAKVKMGTNAAKLSPEGMFRFTVAQAATAKDGGMAWDAGTYIGGGWEDGVKAMFEGCATYMNTYGEAIKNTLPSTSFVTAKGSTLNTIKNGIVATKSYDDKTEYIHVLNAPTGNTLTLSGAVDGKIFGSATILTNGHPVTITSQDYRNLTLTLQDGDTWDAIDTVIKLNVTDTLAYSFTTVNDTDAAITYTSTGTGTWKTSTGRSSGDYMADLHYSTTIGDSFEFTFNGTELDFLTPTGPGLGNMDVYIDGVFNSTVNASGTATYTPQQALFSARGLSNGTHKLRVVYKSGSYFQVDGFTVFSPSPVIVSYAKFIPGKVTATVVNNSTLSYNSKIVLAYYNNSGRLIDLKIVDKAMVGKESYALDNNVSWDSTTGSVKIFVWELDKLNPLSPIVNISGSN